MLRVGLMVQPRSLDETRQLAREADAAGYAWLGVADSPALYQDSYLHQHEALRASERLLVGPLVSHVVLRHPLILGNALATLNEQYGGRSVGVLGTGNSAARGLDARPARLGDLAEALECIRGYWAGRGGTFKATRVPATGLRRSGCPLFVAGDGPRAAALAGESGDGFFYGGSLDPTVLSRRLEAGCARPGQVAWVGPVPSLADTVEGVLAEIGPQLVAIANRALRGDLGARCVPEPLHEDVRRLWREYDYAFHADSRRPRNLDLISPDLGAYLVDRFAVWGDDSRWRQRMDALAAAGCHGVMFILGHDEPVEAVRLITRRLAEIRYLEPAAERDSGSSHVRGGERSAPVAAAAPQESDSGTGTL